MIPVRVRTPCKYRLMYNALQRGTLAAKDPSPLNPSLVNFLPLTTNPCLDFG